MKYLKGTYKPSSHITKKQIIGRTALSIATFLLLFLIGIYTTLYVIVNGNCQPLRERLVLMAEEASATKWLPELFLSRDEIDSIIKKSEVVITDSISIEDYLENTSDTQETQLTKWDSAVDGMIFETVKGSTFTGYVLLIQDPSRVYVGTSSDFKSNRVGMKIFDMAKKENAVAVINAGEFSDPGGQGDGNNPMGITFSKGECVWEDNLKRTFIGLDKSNNLIVTEPMTKSDALELGIRDGVSFQNGNTLITSSDGEVIFHYSEDKAVAQRTAIGQCADKSIILLVTDGRSASSIGATRNDVIDVMIKYGAVTAGMLDGGSSALMYYEDYYTKYKMSTENLDSYQLKGLVNSYKAFTSPRRLPTYFCVTKEV